MTPRLEELLEWYQTLSPHTLDRAQDLYTADARFRDPFNDVRGPAAIQQIFAHMFRTTTAPRFVVRESVLQERTAFVTWEFHFGLRGRSYTIEGASRFQFAADGRVQTHRDYWDSSEELLQKLPWIGWLVRKLRAAFSVATD